MSYTGDRFNVFNMIGYKLFRVKANGTITSLFINKLVELPLDEWLVAEDHLTEGYKHRPGWHCCLTPNTPHLSEKGRDWYCVEMRDVKEEKRPRSQGGVWYIAGSIKIIDKVGPPNSRTLTSAVGPFGGIVSD